MNLKQFFHKIRIGFTRCGEASLPYTSDAKRYGDNGEDSFVHYLKTQLPNCQIKRNIIIQTADGNAELDCLVLYNNKLFAIEIKCWTGELVEQDGQFTKYKRDRWTGEWHARNHKSPFRQLARAIYLLKKQVPEKAWINAVVYFDGTGNISANSETVWFDTMYDLTQYIQNNGQVSFGNSAQAFFARCVSADCLRSRRGLRRCVICDDALAFTTSIGVIRKKDIASISIEHHWSYDELYVKTRQGITYPIKAENEHIRVMENGCTYSYAFCKLDYIEVGI